MVNSRQVGLLELSGQLTSSWGQPKSTALKPVMSSHCILAFDVRLNPVRLTLGASPSSDVAVVVVGQDLTGGRDGTELDVVVQSSISGQTQEGDVISDG